MGLTQDAAREVLETLVRESLNLSTLAARYDEDAAKRHGLAMAMTHRGVDLRKRSSLLMDAAIKLAEAHGLLPEAKAPEAAGEPGP